MLILNMNRFYSIAGFDHLLRLDFSEKLCHAANGASDFCAKAIVSNSQAVLYWPAVLQLNYHIKSVLEAVEDFQRYQELLTASFHPMTIHLN